MKILVVDIETSGFDLVKDVIFEIGIVQLDLETGDIVKLFDEPVREPHLCGNHRDAWIFSNSDMTPEYVRNAQPLENYRNILNDIFSNEGLNGMTAFNRNFDFGFLKHRKFKLPKPLPCPMLLSTDILKIKNTYGRRGYKWPSAQEAWDYYFPNEPYVEKHRGADDARIEAKIIYEMYKRGIFTI